MKFDNLRAFEKHVDSASPNHFSNIYLILSKEYSESQEAIHYLLKALAKGEHVTTYEGSTVTSEAILNDLNSPSFFSPTRVILIHQADKLKKALQEELQKYMQHPSRSMYLILSAPALLKNTTFYKTIEKNGIVLDLPELKPWEKEKRLIEWVTKQASNARKVISHPAAQHLVKQIGADQNLIASEFEKLLCYIGDRQEITMQDITAICSNLPSETIWQLGEAVFRRDAPAAIRATHVLLNENGNSLLPFLRQLRSQFQTGYHISQILLQGGNGATVSQEYPYMKGQILEKNMQTAQQYGVKRYRQGLLAIDEAELKAKNSQMEEDLLAELLIIKLTS